MTDGSHQSCQGWGWGQQFWIKTKKESNKSELRGGAGKSQATEELVPRASRVRQSYGRVSHEHDREGFDRGDARSWCAAPSFLVYCRSDSQRQWQAYSRANRPVQVCNCLGQSWWWPSRLGCRAGFLCIVFRENRKSFRKGLRRL